jgi:membrane dipeptidase
MILINKFLASIMALSNLAAAQPTDIEKRALKLHHSILTMDTHCDTPMSLGRYDMGVRHKKGQGCQDFPRMKDGGLSASCFAVYLGQGPRTPAGYAKAKERALAAFDNLDRMFKKHAALCEQAYTVADIARIAGTGKRAVLVSMENGYPIGLDLKNIDTYHSRGARMMGLVHNGNNDICDSSMGLKGGIDRGLSEFGKSVVKRMNELGIVIDISHASDKSFFDVLALSKAPIIASHSSSRAMCRHPRNLTDEQLLALKKNGGVIQLCILSDFIIARDVNPEYARLRDELETRIDKFGGWEALREKPEGDKLIREYRALRAKFGGPKATVKQAVDHIDHIVKLIGIDHVGIGTDFDGGGGLLDCQDVTELPKITIELVRRGYSDKDIKKIWGENALRVFEMAQKYQPPPRVISSRSIVNPAEEPYHRRSDPTSTILSIRSRKFPANVMRSTLSSSEPLRIRMPLAPTLMSPETGFMV